MRRIDWERIPINPEKVLYEIVENEYLDSYEWIDYIDTVKKLGITESAISQHMKVLKEAELVYGERFGYHIHYLPKQDALDGLCAAFSEMKQQSLDLCRDPQICQCEYREEKQ